MSFSASQSVELCFRSLCRQLERLCAPGWDSERHRFLLHVRDRGLLMPVVEDRCRRLVAGEHPDGVVLLNTLLNSPVIRDDRTLRSFVHHCLAVAYRQRGMFAPAVVHQQCAGIGPFDEDDGSPTLLTRADLFSAWGQDALIAGDYRLARDYFTRALSCERAAKDETSEAADWAHLGLVDYAIGHHRTGLRHLWHAVKMHRRLRDVAGQVQDLMNLAVIYEQTGRCRFALGLLRHALVKLEGVDLPLTRTKAQKLTKRVRHLVLLQQSLPILN